MKKIALLSIFLLLQACAQQHSLKERVNKNTLSLPSKGIYLNKTDVSQIDGWNESDHKMAQFALLKSCTKFLTMAPSQMIGWPAGKVQDWQDACFKIDEYDNEDAKLFWEENFDFYEIFKDEKYTDNIGLFTGYYVPELEGSIVKTARFKYPLYRYPADKNLLGLSREEIKNGAFDGKGLELMYVDDPIELFFLHIQGSGRIKLQNGETVRIGYSGSNGQRYTAIGRYLVENGEMKEKDVSLDNIKKWLKSNPTRAQEVMNKNKRFVYFKIVRKQDAGKSGPKGAFDVELTPYHSVAIDKRFIPMGVALFVSTEVPNEDGGADDFNEILLAQDTGGGVEGLIRGDIFFGMGDDAKKLAGNMKHRGKMYIMVPKKKIKTIPIATVKNK
jgi:membrane-bound lytic murein transglycosylase A